MTSDEPNGACACCGTDLIDGVCSHCSAFWCPKERFVCWHCCAHDHEQEYVDDGPDCLEAYKVSVE